MLSVALELEARVGKKLLACMAGLKFWVLLDLASNYSFEVGSMTEWFDDVLSIVLQKVRRSKANKVTNTQFFLCHKHHLKLLMPSDDLDKVSTCPARQFTLLADSVGRPVASSRVGTLLFLPCFQGILIETVDRCTKDALAEMCKSSSMLTQDSINQAIREINVRIECIDGIEYIPQKRVVEVWYLNFTVKREM